MSYSSCDGSCVDEQTDDANCGGCGVACAGTCTAGVCVLGMGQTGCGTPGTTCVAGGCYAGTCLGTIGVVGEVACGAGQCSTDEGCSSVCQPGASSCATPPTCGAPDAGGESFVACDAPNDCATGQDCCQTYNCAFQTTQQCYPRTDPAVVGSGCPASSYCTNTTIVCDPTNPVCPTGTCRQNSTDAYVCE
jgi:hypothetical protein